MILRIGHMSDLHGNLSEFLAGSEMPDVWVVTGDFFPNNDDRARWQESFQAAWFKRRAEKIVARFGGKPVLWVPGNHDFICLVEMIKSVDPDYPAYVVSPEGIEVLGVRWAGFREINFIVGEWQGETMPDAIRPIVERTMASDPQILLTHAPPAGIMCDQRDSRFNYGVTSLANYLCYRPHGVVAHFFGHAHDGSGEEEVAGIRFFNGSHAVRFHNIEV